MGALLLVAALGLGAGSSVFAGVAGATPSEEACFLASINAARSAAGVSPVGLSLALAAVARAHSQQMAASATLSHNADLANEAPSGWLALGENVGAGASCDAVAQLIYGDAPHRANLLDPRFDSVGVGVADGAGAMLYVTEDFVGTGTALPPVPGPTPLGGSPAGHLAASSTQTIGGTVGLEKSLASKGTGSAFAHPAGVAVPIVGDDPPPAGPISAGGIIGNVLRAIGTFLGS